MASLYALMFYYSEKIDVLFREFVWYIVGIEFDIQIMLTSCANLAKGHLPQF